MSDPDEARDDVVTADTTDAPEAAAESTPVPPPWGEDFNPERAWNTIQTQRARELELEAEAKELKRLRNDPQAQREFLESLGYEIPEDEPEPEDDEDDPIAPVHKKLGELEQWKQEKEAAEAARAFEDHLTQLASTKEVELTDRQRRQILRDSLENGFSPEATEKAFNDLIEELSEYEKRAIERYTGSKRTPPVAGSSKSATQVPDLDDPKQRNEWLKQRERELRQQQ